MARWEFPWCVPDVGQIAPFGDAIATNLSYESPPELVVCHADSQ